MYDLSAQNVCQITVLLAFYTTVLGAVLEQVDLVEQISSMVVHIALPVLQGLNAKGGMSCTRFQCALRPTQTRLLSWLVGIHSLTIHRHAESRESQPSLAQSRTIASLGHLNWGGYGWAQVRTCFPNRPSVTGSHASHNLECFYD